MSAEDDSPPGERTTPIPRGADGGDEGQVSSAETLLSTDAQALRRYELREVLGEGGMGIVYEAWDRQLKRMVAVKLLRSDDRASVERFLREARSQARVEHTNICKVYEVGRMGGRPYIAMQRVRGLSCADLAAELTVERKVRLMRDVAEALQAAHAVGLIHRDIKPSNILVERRDDGELVPFVTDFGIARDPQAPGLTTDGEALGSPAYMAPEQALGETERMDRRTDVYGLGATLFELLAGRPPFAGRTALEVMQKVVDEEPPGLATLKPGVPADLATIVHKCLEKEPARRYASARALADDLGRFLLGEPIEARRTTFAGRIRRRVKKHRVASALLAAAALVILALAGWLARSARLAAEREEYARQFGQEAERVESMLRVAALTPLHDTRPERQAARRAVEAISARLPLLPRGGRAAAEFAVGRGLLALGEPSEALPHLQAAWDAGIANPESAFALGRALGDVYRKELAVARRLGDEAKRKARLAELDAKYRQPAVAFLGRARALPSAAPDYVLGMIAFQEGKLASASELAARAFAKTPSLFEAKRLEGDVHQASGFEEHVHGRTAEAAREYRAALDAYTKASEIARSDPRILEAACRVQLRFLELDNARGEDLEKDYEAVATRCRTAASADSDYSIPWNILSLAAWRRGDALRARGIDPTGPFAEAVAFADEAFARDPKDYGALTWAGVALIYRGEWERERGADPTASEEAALARFRRAAQIEPQWSIAYNGMSGALLNRGARLLARGTDPTAVYEEAEKSSLHAFALDPKYVQAIEMAGEARLGRARWRRRAGQDAAPLLDGAEEAFRKAEAINPTEHDVQMDFAWLALERAEAALGAGRDPSPFVAEALKRAEAAARTNGSSAAVPLARGRAALVSGKAAARTGGAGTHFAEAEAFLTESLKRKPGEPDALAARAELAAARADGSKARGRAAPSGF